MGRSPASARFFRVALAALALFLSMPAFSQQPDDAAAIKRVEALTEDLTNLRNLSDALDTCRRVLKHSPKNFQALLTASRICWHLGVQTENEDRAKEIFRRGYEQAQHLQLAYPEKADGYYWYAVNFGEFVERSSIFTKMAAPGKITAMAKKVLQLDPSYDGGGAYLMLGRINQLMPGGDEKLAEDYFKKSVGYAPNRTTSHLYLAQLYYDEKRYEEAMAEAEIVLSVKPEKRFIVEYRQDVPEAKQWRAKIAEKLGRHRESRRFSPYGRHHAGVAWIFHPARFKISSAQR